jgi:phosphoribosylaminoimidazole carboxylase
MLFFPDLSKIDSISNSNNQFHDLINMQESKVYGLLGGGQLGKYLIHDQYGNNQANNDISFQVLSPEPPLVDSGIMIKWIKGDINDLETVLNFGRNCDVITIEIENVSVDALDILKKEGKRVIPDPDILRMIKNKLSQKMFLIDNSFPASKLYGTYHYPDQVWHPVNPGQEVHKLQLGGYDGRGVLIPKDGGYFTNGPTMVEELVNIQHEVSVIVGRNRYGDLMMFEPCLLNMNPKTHMLDHLICPVPSILSDVVDDDDLHDRLWKIVTSLTKKMNLVGIMAIEFFIQTGNSQIIINEMSPRPHNSGHHTIDRYNISQNELLRMILREERFSMNDLKLKNLQANVWDIHPDQTLNPNCTRCITLLTNIVGTEDITHPIIKETLFFHPNYQLYWYGKTKSTKDRKMGHLTYTYVYHPHLYDNLDIYHHTLRMKYSTQISINDPKLRRLKPMIPISRDRGFVSVIMGSSSDLKVVYDAIDILNQFHVPYQVEIVSAHRTPHEMLLWSRNSKATVIIAAAGGAAHLPGMVASATTVPVVGIPVKSANSINGIDSLLSICQMPSGIPVGTMAVDGAINAALYAIRILSINQDFTELRNLLTIYAQILKEKVILQNDLPDYF